MPRGKRSEPTAPAPDPTPATLTVRGQVGPATIEITVLGMERRPLLLILDEVLGALQAGKKKDE